MFCFCNLNHNQNNLHNPCENRAKKPISYQFCGGTVRLLIKDRTMSKALTMLQNKEPNFLNSQPSSSFNIFVQIENSTIFHKWLLMGSLSSLRLTLFNVKMTLNALSAEQRVVDQKFLKIGQSQPSIKNIQGICIGELVKEDFSLMHVLISYKGMHL